jgi:hypothetical protein
MLQCLFGFVLFSERVMVTKTAKCWLTLLLVLGALAVPAFAAPHHASSESVISVFSDFDRDNKLDEAELVSNGEQKSIHVTLGEFGRKSLSFDSGLQDHGRLLSYDVDSDGDQDLLWMSLGYPKRFVLWLGDGRGNFSIASGDEADRLQVLLQPTPARIATDPEDGGSAVVLQDAPLFVLQYRPAFQYTIRSERYKPEDRIETSYPVFLSVLRKRGPPSLFI